VCRRIESHFIRHGMLVGVVAALIYVALTFARLEHLVDWHGARSEACAASAAPAASCKRD
jgi:cell division protein FtsX